MNYFLQYYGLDWLAVGTGLVAMYMIGDKRRSAFIIYIVSAAFSLAFAIIIKSLPFILVNLLTIGIQVRNYLKWGQEQKQELSVER